MPAWKGWNESDVREHPGRPAPAMGGFTPINASASTAAAADRVDGDRSTAADLCTNRQAKSIASDYLGRGEREQPTPVPTSQALHGPGAKKNSGKGKKRTPTASTSSRSKRRKSGDVSDSMPVTKAATRGTHSSTKQPAATILDAGNKDDSANSHGDASTIRNGKRAGASNEPTESHQPVVEPTHAMPVYAQPTAMTSFQAGKQKTSLDALKASDGQGATLYSNEANVGPHQQGVEFMKPWLNNAPRPPHLNDSLSRKTSMADQRRLSPVEEEDEFDMLDNSLAERLPVDSGTEKSFGPERNQQLPTPAHSDSAAQVAPVRKQPARLAKKTVSAPPIQTDEDFLVLDDSDAEAMAEAAEAVERRERTPAPRERKLNMRDVDADEDYGGALLSAAERQLLSELKASAHDSMKPIVRKPFPMSVLDRSRVSGATKNTVLRTCFRIGEAMNVGSQAVRMNKNILLELYARVTHSWRDERPGGHQHFVFHDLYHANPPHLNGTFDLWDQSRLWDLDSKAFLVPRKEGIMCRVVARTRREGTRWRFEVLSIREASWEDVEYVAGIYEKRSGNAFLTVDD